MPYVGNDPVRFRRDVAVMWRHTRGLAPRLPARGDVVGRLVDANAEADGKRCHLTSFIEAYRRGNRCAASGSMAIQNL